MTLSRLIPLLAVALLAIALTSGSVMAKSAAAPGASTCTGGTVAAGSYTSLTITGDCSLPDSGTVTVNGGLTIAPGASFNAMTTGTLIVRGGVTVGEGAAFALGCSPETGCDVATNDQISGGLTANQALAVILHSDTIRGHVAINGGGGGVTCDPLLFGGPAFMDIEDSTISGGVSVTGVESCWLGLFRNHVSGSVNVANNTLADPDATEVATNDIRGSLMCSNNSPAAQIGDSEGFPNTVTGQKQGECAGL